MSVLIKQNEEFYIFCKGSPEKLQDLCVKVP